MATMIQTPDSLSLLNNLMSFVISSSSEVAFALSVGGTTIVEETYQPDNNGRVEIQVRDVVSGYLSISLPSSNQYRQTEAAKTFSASVNGVTVATFTVIAGGVRRLSVTPTNFLKANWLTWQPQSKRVTWDSPEYLTYYFVVAGTVKAKFYYKAGGTKVATVASGTAGQMMTFNMAMSRLFSIGDVDPDDMYGLVDVWVEDGSSTQLSYVQRYVCEDTQSDEHVYLAVNSLGGIDTFTFHGERKMAAAVEHESAELEDIGIDTTQEAVRKWEQSTGHLGNKESNWIYELVSSKRAWAVIDGDAEGMEYSDLATLAVGSFSFILSEEGGMMNLVRTSGQLPVIEVPSPTGQLFFLEARLIDYPDADISETLLLLSQSPFSQDWFRLDLGSALGWIYSSIVNSPIGQMAHTHENLLVLGRLSEYNNRLTYRGAQLATLADIPTIPPPPAEWFEPAYDDQREVVGAKALYDLYITQQEADEDEGTPETQKNISEVLRHLFIVEQDEQLYLRTDISFFSDKAVSAGGISDTPGESGGGISPDAMWQLLADATAEQINVSHLTDALAAHATKQWVEAQGYIRAEDIPGIVDPLAITTALAAASTRLDSLEEWTNRPYIEELATDVINTRRLVFDGQAINYIATDEDILDLAVLQAGHDARLEALESWIASPYAAEMTAAALHVERTIDLGGLTLDYDYANNAWHVHGNLYSDGFISAGGISSTGGGSGGGIDPAAMWSLLAAGTNEQINASHLTVVLSPYAPRQWVEAHGYITSTDITSAAVITALGYTPAADDDLHPLAASLAGQSERISAIEAWLCRAYLEDLTTSDLRVERSITLGGTTLVYDYGVGAWHLKGSIYADGFVSAGGYSGSESEGGINEAAMWRLLAADTDEQISISHLTDALTPYATQAWVEAQGYSLTAEAIAIALTYVPVSPDDLLPLSVSLSAESSRLDALESWIASPYAAEMTAAALHVERSIDLGGLTLDYDYANNAWHVHGNLYSDGFISAGGMSPVISSGGIDANAMWALLADTTGEPIAASHLPLSVSLSEGNYVQGISYANGIFTVVRATMPESMKNPAALNFGSKSYDGSAAVSLTASDLGAITYVRNFGQTLTRGTTKTIATVGSTDITVTVPNFAFASDIPTLLPNPYALTFGSKTYDGSAARTITASDLGALTSHQRIYSLRIYNSAGSSVLYYIPTYGDETLTLTKAMVGLGNVENTALSTWSGSSYITTLGTITSGTWNGSAIANSYLANSSITLAGRSVSLGGSISKGTMLSDLGLSSATSDISTLFGYFTNGVANSAARLSDTASKTAWGQTFWSSGTPDSVSGAMSSVTNINALLYFYNSNTRLGIGTSRPAYALDVAGSIQASSDIIAGGYIYIGGTSAYIRYVSTNAGLNVNVGLYSNSYISAGGLSSSSDRRLKTDIRSIDDRRAWSVISKLRPVEFRWITTGEQCSGLIAQEVEPYLPEAVTEVGGIKRLRYDVVFTYGLAALNSLRLQASSTQRRIDTLERRVRTLEQKLRINNKS